MIFTLYFRKFFLFNFHTKKYIYFHTFGGGVKKFWSSISLLQIFVALPHLKISDFWIFFLKIANLITQKINFKKKYFQYQNARLYVNFRLTLFLGDIEGRKPPFLPNNFWAKTLALLPPAKPRKPDFQGECHKKLQQYSRTSLNGHLSKWAPSLNGHFFDRPNFSILKMVNFTSLNGQSH